MKSAFIKDTQSIAIQKQKSSPRIIIKYMYSHYIPGRKISARLGVLVNSILTWNGCIKRYISLIREIILQQFDEFKTEICGSPTKHSSFEGCRGHPSKVAK